MNVSDLQPTTTHHDAFARHCLKFVPAKSGCYVLTTFDGVVLYVGLSVNLRSRLLQHLDDVGKTAPCEQGRAVVVHWLPTEAREATERAWLNQYQCEEGKLPPFNSVQSPVSG